MHLPDVYYLQLGSEYDTEDVDEDEEYVGFIWLEEEEEEEEDEGEDDSCDSVIHLP